MLSAIKLACLVSLSLMLSSGLPAGAQQQAQKNQIDQMQASGEYRVLTKAIELPNFPAYAGGGQFLWGNVRYRKDGGAEVTMRYACTDPAANVLAWYKQTLTNLKWTVGQTSERMLAARYKTMNTTVITFPSNNPQYACQLNIVFNMGKSVPSD